jgi:hypothetical protein
MMYARIACYVNVDWRKSFHAKIIPTDFAPFDWVGNYGRNFPACTAYIVGATVSFKSLFRLALAIDRAIPRGPFECCQWRAGPARYVLFRFRRRRRMEI